MVSDEQLEKYKAGFDRIDKDGDGVLSREEILEHRDNQITKAKIVFWGNPGHWFNPKAQADFTSRINAEESKTKAWRNEE